MQCLHLRLTSASACRGCTAGLIGTISLKMDEDSDDELQALAEMYSCEEGTGGTGAGDARAHRFALLKELWASAR